MSSIVFFSPSTLLIYLRFLYLLRLWSESSYFESLTGRPQDNTLTKQWCISRKKDGGEKCPSALKHRRELHMITSVPPNRLHMARNVVISTEVPANGPRWARAGNWPRYGFAPFEVSLILKLQASCVFSYFCDFTFRLKKKGDINRGHNRFNYGWDILKLYLCQRIRRRSCSILGRVAAPQQSYVPDRADLYKHTIHTQKLRRYSHLHANTENKNNQKQQQTPVVVSVSWHQESFPVINPPEYIKY